MTSTPLVRRPLTQDWTLTAGAGPVPAAIEGRTITATVPGCVHVDLLAAQLIPDPYLDDNESLLAWIGRVDWTYRTRFTWSRGDRDRHDLVFDGLDTVARVELNGTTLIETANQHRSYRLPVDGLLVEGENDLVVRFTAPVPYANAQSLALGVRPRPYPLPYEAIRKSACNFGWDWGIATFTSGIWREVRLESWTSARLDRVLVDATPDGDGGVVTARVQIDRADAGAPLAVRLTVGGESATVPISAGEATVHVALDRVERWWPIGYGAQPLSDVAVELVHAGGVIDRTERRVGFRTVRWDTTADAEGTPFTLVVNDQPVFVKGVNWIPDDALPVRVDRARYRRRLEQAVEANLNLIRVWGGGIYENDDFYELCDELGLLTWQDFLFACAAYPEEEPLRSEIEAEAYENVARLAHHASLVLLTGNNENLWGFEDWDWKRRLDGKTWGAYYYYELFPRVIAEIAAHVPYAPGSPFSPGGQHPNAEEHGTMHLWEQWNRQDWLTYRDHRPRFVAEFGWQGPPAWSTLVRSISDAPLTPESPGMIVHQKAMEGNVKLTTGLVPHFRVPEDMESWHWAMQLNQAIAVRTALDHFRSWAPHTMGAIVWQLNDCWPVTSWAAIDGDERPKPLFYALRQSFAPRVITVQPRESGLAAVLGNDTDAAWEGHLRVRRLGLDGTVHAEETLPLSVAPRASATVPLPASVAVAGDAASEFLAADAHDARGFWFFAEARNSALTAAQFDLSVKTVPGGSEVTVTARSLIRDLTFLVDKLDPAAHAEEGLLTLLPGETATVRIRHRGALDAEALASPAVARSANQLVTS
ncbi:glycoside hydrolase family 2 protein [Microbacterium sp. RG1]|uniref:glycoside hydrolase family 2 protein n=1 Tax=Microbacterium sp. RG1 TaxID=2489212 RepID=UPI0010CA3853|nr:glycoside hydrolase family 2 protein [Microbacterium sp. RG1]QCQ17166.1 glycoside hydrolase family 2 protein [Microbacterium sp. RG1]